MAIQLQHQLPICDYVPEPYGGPSREEVLAIAGISLCFDEAEDGGKRCIIQAIRSAALLRSSWCKCSNCNDCKNCIYRCCMSSCRIERCTAKGTGLSGILS